MWVGPPHGEERRLLSDGGKSRGCALGNSGRSVYRSSVGARGRCPKHWFGRDAMEQEVPVSRGSVRTNGGCSKHWSGRDAMEQEVLFQGRPRNV